MIGKNNLKHNFEGFLVRFRQLTEETVKNNTARAEEEKILLLRLSSRDIKEVEQTDVQVRKTIWTGDTKERVLAGETTRIMERQKGGAGGRSGEGGAGIRTHTSGG